MLHLAFGFSRIGTIASHSPRRMGNNLSVVTLRHSHVAKRTLSTDMFLRRELKPLATMLTLPPKISVFSGPISSGKSYMVRYLLNKTENPCLNLNLRSTNMRSQVNLDKFFEIVDEKFPKWHEDKTAILAIDEAHELKTLSKTDEGSQVLTKLFQWLVMKTKEQRRVHVILSSHDSFFPHFVAQQVGGFSQFTNYVVGNLSKEEARQYWDNHLLKTIQIPQDINPPSFKDAYALCGGNMYFLERYVVQHIEQEGKMEERPFSPILAEKIKIMDLLYKEFILPISSHYNNCEPITDMLQWKIKPVVDVMKKLTQAPNKFLIYDDLCRDTGKRTVDSLIKHKLLHLRSAQSISFDLPEAPADKAIVTAETPPSLVAMRNILKVSSFEHSCEKKKKHKKQTKTIDLFTKDLGWG